MAVSRAHVRWAWLAAGSAVTAAALLLVGGERLRSAFDSLTHAAPHEESGPLLGGSAPESASDAGPVLQGARRQAPGEREPAHGPVTVTVLDRAGLPIAGARVVQGTNVQQHADGAISAIGFTASESCSTDAGGRARFPDVAYDGTAEVAVVLQAAGTDDVLGTSNPGVFYVLRGNSLVLHLTDGSREISPNTVVLTPNAPTPKTMAFAGPHASAVHARVTGPEVTLTMNGGLPLEVDVRAADGGRALSTRWQVTPRLEWAPDACESPRIPATAGREVSICVKVEPPRGMLAPRAEPWSVWVHPGAARLRAVVPVRTEADLVAAFPAEVLPFREEQWAGRVSVGGSPASAPTFRAGREGRVRIHGVPHLIGETVALDGLLAERWSGHGDATMGADARETVLVPVRCEPASPDVGLELFLSADTLIRLDGQTVAIQLHAVGQIDAFGSGSAPVQGSPTVGALRVRVLLPSGAPARGASVRGAGSEGWTDKDGIVVLRSEPASTVRLTIGGAGAPTWIHVGVKAGETTDVEVRTTAGGALAIEVVDVLDRALPFAKVAVQQTSGFPWIDLDGDVQRIDPYTDERGRRTLRTVEPGLVKVSAAYGSRAVESEVEVLEGETTRVRLVLPAGDAPAKAAELPPAPPEPDAPAR